MTSSALLGVVFGAAAAVVAAVALIVGAGIPRSVADGVVLTGYFAAAGSVLFVLLNACAGFLAGHLRFLRGRATQAALGLDLFILVAGAAGGLVIVELRPFSLDDPDSGTAVALACLDAGVRVAVVGWPNTLSSMQPRHGIIVDGNAYGSRTPPLSSEARGSSFHERFAPGKLQRGLAPTGPL